MNEKNMKAIIDFGCIEENCHSIIQFNLLELKEAKGNITCKDCHRIYQFDKPFLMKLEKLRHLVLAVQNAEDILGDCHVSVKTTTDEVKIPYRLLLTRLNTLISLNCNGKKVDFNFRVEPLNDGLFK